VLFPLKAKQLSKILRDLADPVIAAHSQRFFKTGKGEYGEGDRFLGIRVPAIRRHVKNYSKMALEEIQCLLTSRFHEERLAAILLLVHRFSRGDAAEQAAVYRLYLDHTRCINNWDLVDISAHSIVGAYLENKDKRPLYALAESDRLWERRIAVMATFHFIRKRQFDETLTVSKQLIGDNEDLIHKAVGWMLREIGKRDLGVEKAFLKVHYQKMPRTMLRYAIEKFPEPERNKYLLGAV
jgi:3-methyladenine DNA glycosylase AlkD